MYQQSTNHASQLYSLSADIQRKITVVVQARNKQFPILYSCSYLRPCFDNILFPVILPTSFFVYCIQNHYCIMDGMNLSVCKLYMR